jgi:phenylacetate-CoA ligase
MLPVEMYDQVVEKVIAYQKFLKNKVGQIPEVKSLEDFNKLPLIDKSSYIMDNKLEELCFDNDTSEAHLWLRSSGTSHKPFFWPRRYVDEKNMFIGIEKLFNRYVTEENQPTLIIVGLALGPWGTGMQTSFIFRSLAQRVKGLAVVSPGLQNENIIECLEKLSPMFKRTLLLSYPPFAKNVLEEAAKRGIDLPTLNIEVMVGGEGISELFRDNVRNLLGHSKDNLYSVWSLYGSTDFGNVGFENPMTILIRRLISENNLWEKIFGISDVPMLFQTVPRKVYFEDVKGELVVSCIQGIPLIRYRSGDHVKFITKNEILEKLKDFGFDAKEELRKTGLKFQEWETPLIALYGRIDQVVFFYGAKITLEQFKKALEAETMLSYFNGKFLVKATEDSENNPLIELYLEDNVNFKKHKLEEIEEIYSVELAKVQSEFRTIRDLFPNKKNLKIIPSKSEVFELGWKTRHM